MSKLFETTKNILNYMILTVNFAFSILIKTEKYFGKLLGRFLFSIAIFSNVSDLLIAFYKAYQDGRDWFLLRKRLNEFRMVNKNIKNTNDLIEFWEWNHLGEDQVTIDSNKQRAARARELVGAWNIFHRIIFHGTTILLKLCAVIACVLINLILFTGLSVAIKGIFGIVASGCFAGAFALGFCICAFKIVDAFLKLKRLKRENFEYSTKKKALQLQLISSVMTGTLCLVACAALMITIFAAFFAGPAAVAINVAMGVVGIATTVFLALVVLGTYLGSKKIMRSGISQNISSDNEKENQSSLKMYKKLALFIKIKSDNGLFWKNKKKEYTRDALLGHELKTSECQRQANILKKIKQGRKKQYGGIGSIIALALRPLAKHHNQNSFNYSVVHSKEVSSQTTVEKPIPLLEITN